ncbi:hypothetical protein GAS19_10275 [Burkholderia glumae]|uniref:hypothetical protein n=2 Tax=Burkholderia glumae TaxID=337 RepID=UPI0012963896|nr:hypothetical protein [Burkholderia glumae]QGA37975.1 hypothetical protein GAS19_10275 [Burkholderia glumae]
MKKLMLLAAGAVLAVASLAGCSTASQQSAAGALATLQTAVKNGCTVVQPTLVAVAAIDPAVSAAAAANGLFCTAATSITVTSAQALIGTGIPAIETAVLASKLIPDNQKPIAIAALGVLQLSVTQALSVYGQASATTAAATASPASASEAAPASSAAAQ